MERGKDDGLAPLFSCIINRYEYTKDIKEEAGNVLETCRFLCFPISRRLRSKFSRGSVLVRSRPPTYIGTDGREPRTNRPAGGHKWMR